MFVYIRYMEALMFLFGLSVWLGMKSIRQLLPVLTPQVQALYDVVYSTIPVFSLACCPITRDVTI